jgi:hypothetical protein
MANDHRPTTNHHDGVWPYHDLAEQPSDEELAALDPDVRQLVTGQRLPFSMTLVFPAFDGPDYERAVQMARSSAEYRQTGDGPGLRHRARFWARDASRLRQLWNIVGRIDATEVLVDDRAVPYARELWLPLVWLMIP